MPKPGVREAAYVERRRGRRGRRGRRAATALAPRKHRLTSRDIRTVQAGEGERFLRGYSLSEHYEEGDGAQEEEEEEVEAGPPRSSDRPGRPLSEAVSEGAGGPRTAQEPLPLGGAGRGGASVEPHPPSMASSLPPENERGKRRGGGGEAGAKEEGEDHGAGGAQAAEGPEGREILAKLERLRRVTGTRRWALRSRTLRTTWSPRGMTSSCTQVLETSCGPTEEEETQSEDDKGLEDDRIRDTGLGLSRVELGASSSYTPGPRLRPSQLRGGGVGKHRLEEARVAPASGPLLGPRGRESPDSPLETRSWRSTWRSLSSYWLDDEDTTDDLPCRFKNHTAVPYDFF